MTHCGTCKFFYRDPDPKNDMPEHIGHCRANPPQVTYIPVPVPNLITGKAEMGVKDWSGWPAVQKHQWCGMWEGKIAILQ